MQKRVNRMRLRRAGTARMFARAVGATTALVFAAAALIAVQSPQPAKALDGSQFNAGYIIDDSKFYDSNAMSQSAIQSFLEAQEQGSCSNSLCLKQLTYTTSSRSRLVSDTTGNVRCEAYAGAANETAAAIIFKVQRACGISAKVILVTLQKEQGLITKLAPSQAAMDRAMGYACPDTAPCAATSLGFGNQIYMGALQLKTYKASKFSNQPGTWAIRYSPTTSCGTRTVTVVNYGTAALYDYTPYTPNTKALANLNGTGDSCSSYGNRNFWVYYNNWFGNPTGGVSGALQSVTPANNSVTVTGWAVDGDSPSSAATLIISGQGWSFAIGARAANSASLGAFPQAGSNHGFSATLRAAVGQQQVCATGVTPGGVLTALGCIGVTVPSALPAPTQIAGTDRFDTAVKISQRTAPGVPTVYVASGENFPDALSVAAAAAHAGVPLLLVTSTSVPSEVQAELVRLDPGRIVLVGGSTVISDAVESQLGRIAPVTRIGGADRYDTSLQIGSILGGDRSGAAYLATGSNFPDALSAASAAGARDAPLLLVNGTDSSVAPALSTALQQWGVTRVSLIGGTSVVTPEFEAALRTVPGVTSVTRIAGTDRYATSAAVNAAVFPNATTGAYLAAGTAFPDGLSGGALAGKETKPLYLVPGSCVPAATFDQLVHAGAAPVTLIGGTAVMTPAVKAFAPC